MILNFRHMFDYCHFQFSCALSTIENDYVIVIILVICFLADRTIYESAKNDFRNMPVVRVAAAISWSSQGLAASKVKVFHDYRALRNRR